MAKRYELPDESWELIADIFIEIRCVGRPRTDDRLMLNGVLWVLCSGAAWRDMPERFRLDAQTAPYPLERKRADRFGHLGDRLHRRTCYPGILRCRTKRGPNNRRTTRSGEAGLA